MDEHKSKFSSTLKLLILGEEQCSVCYRKKYEVFTNTREEYKPVRFCICLEMPIISQSKRGQIYDRYIDEY